MNDVANKINLLEQDYNNNINEKYATSYEESEICFIDNQVLTKIQKYINEGNTISSECQSCLNRSNLYRYNHTSDSLVNLSKSIKSYLDTCKEIITIIQTASKKAYDEVYSEFNNYLQMYKDYISKAKQYLSRARSNYADRNRYSNMPERESDYKKYDHRYREALQNAKQYYSYAKSYYDQLLKFINSEGMKKKFCDINTPSMESGSDYYEDSGNLREVTNGNVTTEYYPDGSVKRTIEKCDNGTIIVTERDETGKIIKRTVSDYDGNIIEETSDKSNEYTIDSSKLTPGSTYADYGLASTTEEKDGVLTIHEYGPGEVRVRDIVIEDGVATITNYNDLQQITDKVEINEEDLLLVTENSSPSS